MPSMGRTLYCRWWSSPNCFAATSDPSIPTTSWPLSASLNMGVKWQWSNRGLIKINYMHHCKHVIFVQISLLLTLVINGVVATKIASKQNFIHSSSSSLCSCSVPWLGKGLSMLLPHVPILRYPLPGSALPVLV